MPPPAVFGPELLTVAEMYAADAAALTAGISGERLMEAAGRGVADAIRRRWAPRPVAVLCGPGNNGGDGFVVARLLKAAGWPVRLALLGDRDRLTGDAACAAARWPGVAVPLDAAVLDGCGLVVDALFGAGLARPVEGVAAAVLHAVTERGIPCVAVDVPSGVHGDTGAVLGTAVAAALTVTFFRRKPGHLLLPGRPLCGETVVVDIGTPAHVLDEIRPSHFENLPALWLDRFPWPRPEGHKYSRGHAVVVGGAEITGAARLAAAGAMRIGAGLVTVAMPPAAFSIYAMALPGVLHAPIRNLREFVDLIADKRKNAILLGPGNGVGRVTRDRVLAALGADKAVVLDADAITACADAPERLFDACRGRTVVMTPHDGEFARLFGRTSAAGGKVERASAAALASHATILLKGGDTVVAAPDGRVAITANAPPTLATAGSGDVLAGMTVALLAQGMPAFDAAAAAAWMHGEAARLFGPGLIAEDLPEMLPAVLRRLAELRTAANGTGAHTHHSSERVLQ